MTRLRRVALALTVAATGAAATALAPGNASAAAVTVNVQTLNFKVRYDATPVGASAAVTRECNIVGDLYVPSDASPTHREPAILTTNGFGGSKADQAGLAEAFGQQGYITLSYSGLGFGGSGCPITDDDPSSDGVAARQLVSFLGGATGIAYTSFDSLQGWSGDAPALQDVLLDTCNHAAAPACGSADAHDPRVGMIGGSYGGQIQFAAAVDDPRIDTIVPLITWHDLSYSLDPGNSNLPGDKLAPGLPGVTKKQWDNFFFGLGVAASGGASTSGGGAPNPQALGEPQPDTLTTFGPTDALCPGFQPETCTAEAQANLTGTADTTAQAFFTHSSVTSYLDRIRIPVFFGQGEEDTLFNLQEAAATYTALRERGIPVKMDWQSWGHSRIGAAPGEYSSGSDTLTTFQGKQFLQWFNHYLKGDPSAPALDFSYFRDYAYTANGTDNATNEPAAAAAYGVAPAFPTGSPVTYDLSGSDALVPAGAAVQSGAGSFTAVPGGNTSNSITDVIGVVGSYTNPIPQAPVYDTPGTAATWTSTPLTADTDVVGMPTLDVTVTSGEAQTATDPTTQLVMFAKLYDVAADGTTVDLPERLISPVRVANLGAAGSTARVHVTLPGIVHRFAKGHALRLVLASGDLAYAGNLSPRTASFPTSASAPAVLQLPVVGAAATVTKTSTSTAAGKAPTKKTTTHKPAVKQPSRTLAYTGTSALLGWAALGLAGAGAVTLRRSRRRTRP